MKDLATTDLSLVVTDLAATYLSHLLRHREVSGDIKWLRVTLWYGVTYVRNGHCNVL